MRSHSFAALVCLLNVVSQVLCQTRGVNLGGWLTTEEWITPSLYLNTTAADEWNLCNQLGKVNCLATLEEHWSTFYTRDDLVDIANAGLNTLRIPLGYWAVDLEDYEPYVSGQYPYLIRAVQWANELKLSVMLCLHGAPGSQNGYAGSGLIGPILFPSNSSNTDRTLNVLKNLTDEFSQDIYGGTVTSIELLNEPYLFTGLFTMSELQSFYTQGISTVHNSSSTMNVTFHDAWYGPAYWDSFTTSQASNYLTLDYHTFYAFSPNVNLDRDDILSNICNNSQLLKQPSSTSGIPATVVGEWSLQSGLSGNIVTSSWRTWLRLLFEAQIAAYTPSAPGQSVLGWIFWAWKTEHDVATWSYRRGIAQGYIPADITNPSLLVYPILENGCVDSSYNYTAPASVSSYVAPTYANSTTATAAVASSTGSSGSKSAAPSVARLGELSWVLMSAAWAMAWCVWI